MTTLRNKKVLVTGACGFIGSHLVEALLEEGCNVRAFVWYNSFGRNGWLDSLPRKKIKDIEIVMGDIRDAGNMRDAANDIDVLFHLAALIGIPYSYRSPESYIDTNIKGTLNVLQASRDNDVNKVLITSTSEVYGTALYTPIDEKHPRQGQSPYSATKISADSLAESFYNSFDLPVVTVRPFNTFGPRQSARAVIPTIITQLLAGKKDIRLGSLHPTRDLVYVKDTVEGFVRIAKSDNVIGEELNIATGKEISIGTIANNIIDLINPSAKISKDKKRIRPKEAKSRGLSDPVQKSGDLLAGNRSTLLVKGLEETIEWFRDQREYEDLINPRYTMSNDIYLDAPNVGTLEKKYLNKAVDSGYISTIGPFVGKFEEKFARYLGVKKAVSTQSGTAALHIALHELGIGGGDEVIVPALTFVASVNPVIYVGAKPVFADVDMRSWCIDPEDIEKKITKRTKAILPVHLYGNPCDMDSILKIARKHGLYIIEDATESLGVKYRGKFTGTFGDMGCFSFNGNKVITTGGGGMVIGRSGTQIDHIKFLVNQAREETQGYYHSEIGFNYRMTNIESALGLAQMERLSGFLDKKKAFHRIYKSTFSGIDGIRFQEGYDGDENPYWLTCVCFENKINIAKLQSELRRKGVPTRRLFMPLTEFPHFKEPRGSVERSYRLYERSLCLPGSTLNSERDIRCACRVIKSTVAQMGGR